MSTPDYALTPSAQDEAEEAEEVDRRDQPSPDWTKRYPKEDRPVLTAFGKDPDSFPRAHEGNLRLAEASQAFEKGEADFNSHPYRSRVAMEIWNCTIGTIYARVGIFFGADCSFEAMQRMAAGIDPPAPPAARSADEIEVRDDWLTMYPPEYGPLLVKYGVPTIAGSQVDDYNRRFIELVSADCSDPAVLEKAAGSAVIYAFAGNWLEGDDLDDDDRDAVRYMDELDQLDLADVCWERYPEQFRPVLQWLGRPDYEHPKAADYNRAVIAASLYLSEGGAPNEAELKKFQVYLWRAFFGDEPCPA